MSTFARESAISALNTKAELCIIGDGAVGLAAGYLLAGDANKLRIFTGEDNASGKSSSIPSFVELIDRDEDVPKKIPVTFPNISNNASDALKGSSGILVTAPTTEYGALVATMKNVFHSGQAVLLLNAPLGAGLQFANQLRRAKIDCQLNILELGALFECASINGSTLRIFGERDKVSVCGNSRNETRRALSTTTSLSKALVPSSNLLERSFSESERIIRCVLILFGLLGGRGNELSNLSTIVNPPLTLLIRALEAELRGLGQAYNLTTRSFLEHLTDLSAVHWDDADCLDQALVFVSAKLMRQFQVESGNKEPRTLAFEVFKQDICETLVLIEDLSRVARVHMRVLESIIELANVVAKCDLRKSGRTLSDLGLFGMDLNEILEVVNA
jgi:hypothetical protein